MSEPLDLDALEAAAGKTGGRPGTGVIVAADSLRALIERVRRAEGHRDAAVANWQSVLAKEEELLAKTERMEVALSEIAGDRGLYGYHAWARAREAARAALAPEQAP